MAGIALAAGIRPSSRPRRRTHAGYDAEDKRAADEHRAKVGKAARTYVDALKQAKIGAMKTDNLEEAKRIPGYYGRLHAKRRAKINAVVAQGLAAAEAVVMKGEPLMLPAPVETIELPGINMTPTTASVRGEMEMVGRE